MSTPAAAALDVALRFLERINAHDIDGMAALMAERHRFVDSGGAAQAGRLPMRDAWERYFRMVPDYHVEIDETFTEGTVVVLLGSARGRTVATGRGARSPHPVPGGGAVVVPGP